MTLKKTNLASIVAGLISGSAFAAAPGAPVIGWGEYSYAMVEVSQTATAYKDMVGERKEAVDVTVSWDVWSGDPATSANVYLDGEVVWTGASSAKQATFQISKGGKYEMYIELCNDDGCTRSSESKQVVVADTDGSHLTPLEAEFHENNKPYENKSGKVVSAYFVEWSDYERNFPIDKVPHTNLTHFIYAFVPICGGDGINDSLKTISGSFEALQRACKGTPDFSVAIHDGWAALQKPKKGADQWSDPYKGNFAQMMMMKQANPDLKIVPSIGGWTLSDPFYFMHDEAKRHTFVESVRDFLRTWKFFDGVDIDWEYPGGGGENPNLGDPKDGELYVTLMKELREMMDELEVEMGKEYELSSAIAVAKSKIDVVDYQKAQEYMNYIYVMSYDMAGAFDLNNLGHNSALYQSTEFNYPHPFSAHDGVQALLDQGVKSEKIVMGVPQYGRGWSGVHDYQNDNPMTGRATGAIKGTWEDGVVDYRDIRANRSGGAWEERYDESAEAPYLWNPQTKELITFDNERAVMAKGDYVRRHNLGGLMGWEIDADNGDILNAMHESLGHGGDTPPINKPPVAHPGFDQTVYGPAEVELDGSKSYDPEGEKITYKWSQTSGNQVEIINADQAKATIFVPAVEKDEVYTFSLTVADTEGQTDQKSTKVTNLAEEPENLPPTVTLPESMNVKSGEQFTLNAQAQDPENDPLVYSWNVPSNFEIVSGSSSATLVLKAPVTDVDLSATVTVNVTDGQSDVQASTIINVEKQDVDPGPGLPPGECETEDPDAGKYPPYQDGQVYNGGDVVSYNGLAWKAKWWVQNTAPSLSADAWALHSDVAVSWNAAIAYLGGDEVDYGQRRYKAKWWTQGDTPSSSDVWVDIGEATCP
ncbi:glycosyl hydrolase family 18 protein [Vibrio aestuarianus]|uniref:glycosyl hydrolase family 18 protein n=1 Tax=Vibrio aestuarianus TaxID=28171 RepID=UPI00237D1CE6|nr:glycosyl hydrolase family 18 protein [Vibrio aestuarianus]MDE1329284.1 glycosyl hydrolase family 18 protein [Vibrio aestuarianus]